ncbi:Schizosaccharomyces specific protein Tam8 [Schizosaccharomyces osmophilus]|uniref:Schizosaccharomyces specific protein Tam8 n=1 Tax=Schizosaccharomyces osmophilus TaxID=2545709 RepID=A0AAF0AXT1_9SCHI|nr:Schizosaccharomyces specific protein Tam8 [Schizosaccharomyces osmophilus]WBW74283.1 Schizosaccharomyces specific protein Tam8 [Schizosaccharomyces osmophilus]
MNRTSESVEPTPLDKNTIHWSRERVPVVVETSSAENDVDNEDDDNSKLQRIFMVNRWVPKHQQNNERKDSSPLKAQ